MMTCSFDIEVAQRYGVTEAILLNHIAWWVMKNEANDHNFRDGRYWTYNSYSAFAKLFPFLSVYQIRTAMRHLAEEGLIVTANYNEDPFDKSLWYSLSDIGNAVCKGENIDDVEAESSMLRNPHIDSVKTAPSTVQKLQDDKDIYNNNSISTVENSTDIDPLKENNKRKSPYVPTVRECEREFVEEVWPLYPRRQGKERAIEKYIMHRRMGTTKEEVINGIEAYKRYIDREGVERQFVKQGSTFFSQQAWKDDWGAAKSDLDEVFK